MPIGVGAGSAYSVRVAGLPRAGRHLASFLRYCIACFRSCPPDRYALTGECRSTGVIVDPRTDPVKTASMRDVPRMLAMFVDPVSDARHDKHRQADLDHLPDEPNQE